MVSVLNGSSLVFTAMIDLQRYGWANLSNISARSMWRATGAGGSELLFFGPRGAAYVGELSTMFSPNATYKNDGDGTAVTPMLETPFYEFGRGKDRVRRCYVTYDLRDAATDDPELNVSYITTPEATSYTATTPAMLETSARNRTRRDVRTADGGVAFKIEQTYASSDTRLWNLEAEGHNLEETRQ